MSFFSTLRLALHTLMQNKVRSVLTVIILTVVSLVIVFLFSFAFSLYSSMNENITLMVEENGVSISINTSMSNEEYERYGSPPRMTVSDVEKVLDLLDDGTGNLSTISLSSYTQLYYETVSGGSYVNISPYYAKSNPFLGQTDYLVSGRMWDTSDDNSDSVFVNKSFATAANLSVGDTVSFRERTNNYLWQTVTGASAFIVRGILNEPSSNMSSEYTCYIDYHYFNGAASSNSEGTYVQQINAGMTPQEGETYGVAYQSYITGLADKIEDLQPDAGYGHFSIGSELIYMLDFTNLMTLIFFGVILFISVVIILLSISSVANTVRISAEQNRKFFGVMKAIGMKNKNLRGIILTQVVIMIIVGVAIATGIAFLMSGLLELLLASIINSMFYSVSVPVILSSVSPFVPIITFALLTLFVVLFTRSSLAEISKMDVITVINEVA